MNAAQGASKQDDATARLLAPPTTLQHDSSQQLSSKIGILTRQASLDLHDHLGRVQAYGGLPALWHTALHQLQQRTFSFAADVNTTGKSPFLITAGFWRRAPPEVVMAHATLSATPTMLARER